MRSPFDVPNERVSFSRGDWVVKITLKSPFNLKEVDIKTQSATLGALLDELATDSVLTNVEFFDRISGEVYPDYDVHVNGQPHVTPTDGLGTRLKDGDKVEIIFVMLAGG